MRKRLGMGAAVLFFAGGLSTAHGQLFDFGSDGTFGAIDVPTGTVTLDLPPDGIFNATTINVAFGATLKFNRNALNTPVYLLATGDVFIDGTIDVRGQDGTSSPPVGGQGGPGGFDGGTPGFGDETPPGAGQGPGAGLADLFSTGGDAGYGLSGGSQADDGPVYGSTLLVPLVGGSGGGGGQGQPGGGGGGGGGAILIASNTRIDIQFPGVIDADGGSGSGDGSGGAIRLVAPVVAGDGRLRVIGDSTTRGVGRIRVDTIDRTALQFSFLQTSVTAVGTMMFVFPDVVPQLAIIEAAGEIVPEGQPEPVLVLLPFGSTTSRTVTVQARDFIGIVPINVVLTPESGPPVVYPAEIDMSTGNPAQVIVDVEIPVNTATRIHAWTQ